MTTTRSDTELRAWLVDYLVTNLGTTGDDIDLDASFSDLGIGSRDAVVLSGELAEYAARAVSPVDFWEHPTINGLVEYLTGPESNSQTESGNSTVRGWADEPIAVIGMGCRFPGDIYDPEAFWRFLSAGRSAVGEVPPDRWAPYDDGSAEVAAALSGTTRWGSFLPDIDAFDAEFFEISPREAAKIDPQQRLLLEVAYEALEHAGVRPDSLRRTQTGVFAGACAGEYGYLASTDLSQVDAWSGTGGALSIIANRISYFLDLRGPSVTVDTACSSALVAVHLACQSLRTGDCNLAIAAAVNVALSPVITRSFDQAEAMSPTGQCHVFDAAADGFVRGEGCGAVVLKRLSDALRDGDPVWAVVRGSAVNQDGRSNGLMAPNPAAQMAVLRTAYSNAGVSPHDVDYVEAHANGTLLGDPIEARALGTVLGRGRTESAPLLIGSVKPSLGHLDAAAGIAGFIKAVLAVQRGHIPANLNFEKPNPHIPFEDLRLKVVDRQTDWPATEHPRRAGVSSFGFGGTNAHVVLEQGPDPVPVKAGVPGSAGPVTTLVVRGKTAERVASTARMLAQWMDGAGAGLGLAELAHTLNHHRARYAKFATVAALDREQAVAGLHALAAGYSVPGVVGPHAGRCRPGTVFVYSDESSHWSGMGRQLLVDEPAFAAAVADLEPIFVEQLGFSLLEVINGDAPLDGIDRTEPVVVGMQLALTELWGSYGVQPDAVIGYSTGEVAAAVVGGALSTADGLRVVAMRSRLMASSSGRAATVFPELGKRLADLALHTPTIPVITATGAAPAFDADYWAADPGDERERFSHAVHAAGADHGTFIEVSPHPVLASAISDMLGEIHHHSVGTLARDTHDSFTFHANLNASRTTQPPDTEHLPEPHPVIPNTPWHHTRHWISPRVIPCREPESRQDETTSLELAPLWTSIKERLEAAVSAPRSETLLGEHIEITTTAPIHLWQAWLKPDVKPYPGFHRAQGVETVPVSVLLQTLSAAAAECGATALSDIRFEYPIAVEKPRVIQVVADGESVTVSSAFAVSSPAHGWVRHASARISHPPQHEPHDAFICGIHEMPDCDVSLATELQRACGIEGQAFEWSIRSCRLGPDALHADVAVPEGSTVALLDAATHVARLVDGSGPRQMVPVAAETIRLQPELAGFQGVVEVRRSGGDGGEFIVDISVTAPDGTGCVDVRSLRYTAVESDLGPVAPHEESAPVAWSQIPAEQILGELEARLRAILAKELGMAASALDINRPFPELGLDSMMAMGSLKEAKRLMGFDLSATMFWDHPTVSSLATYLAESLAVRRVPETGVQAELVEVTTDSEDGVLDALFASVESATAGTESGI